MMASGSGANASGTFAVILWEWRNDHHLWEAYDNDVVDLIEDRFQAGFSKPFSLGGVSNFYASREVHLSTSPLERDTLTGDIRPIRRTLINSTDPGGVADGVWWKWKGDVRPWEYYPTTISQAIEEFYQAMTQQRNGGTLDLQIHCPSGRFPYVVDLIANTQTNNKTGFKRSIMRDFARKFRRENPSSQTTSQQQATANLQSTQSSAFQTLSQSAAQQHSIPNNAQFASNPFPVPPNVLQQYPHMQRIFSGNPFGNLSFLGALGSNQAMSSSPSSSLNAASSTSAPFPNTPSSSSTMPSSSAVSATNGSWRLTHPPPSLRKSPKICNNETDQNSNPSSDVLSLYTQVVPVEEVRASMAEDDCNICMEKLTEPSSFSQTDDATVARLSKCGHIFHLACLNSMIKSASSGNDKSLRCPYCKKDHGVRTGICPDGYLQYWAASSPDTGYPDANGALVIRYHIGQGLQGPQHPNPGQAYYPAGFPRTGYIPNNEKGRLVLQMLILAWERRLTFTVGTSTTTSATNSVIWNEIHHKTQSMGHSYPDSDYLDRVIAELAAQGVSEDDLPASNSSLSSAPPKKASKLS